MSPFLSMYFTVAATFEKSSRPVLVHCRYGIEDCIWPSYTSHREVQKMNCRNEVPGLDCMSAMLTCAFFYLFSTSDSSIHSIFVEFFWYFQSPFSLYIICIGTPVCCIHTKAVQTISTCQNCAAKLAPSLYTGGARCSILAFVGSAGFSMCIVLGTSYFCIVAICVYQLTRE